MDKVKVQKHELESILKTNRDKHVEEYKEALGGYYIQAQKDFEKELAKIKAGKEFHTYFRKLNKPESHVKEYNDVIDMLGVTTAVEVYISMEDYLKYYKNEWIWCASWKLSNTPYATLYNTPGVGRIETKIE